jgi:hypothetical protein
VLDDYLDGLISREKALDVYGVAITEDGHLDLEATQEQRSATDPFTSARVAHVIETTEYGPDRTVAVSASLASRLGINDGSLLEVTNGAVPLRGWAKIDPELTGQEITLPGLFALVLGIQAGAEVKLMPL